jgi:hypothetical protein
MYDTIENEGPKTSKYPNLLENSTYITIFFMFIIYGFLNQIQEVNYWVGLGLTWYFGWKIANSNRYLHPYYLVIMILSGGILQKVDPNLLPINLNHPYLALLILTFSLFRLDPGKMKFGYVFEKYLDCASEHSLKQYSFLFCELGIVFTSLYFATISQLGLGSYLTICMLYGAYIANTCYCKSKLKANKRVLARLVIVPLFLIGLLAYRVDLRLMIAVFVYGLCILNCLFILNSFAPLLRKIGFKRLKVFNLVLSMLVSCAALYLNFFASLDLPQSFILQLAMVAIFQVSSGSFDFKRSNWVIKTFWLVAFSACVMH